MLLASKSCQPLLFTVGSADFSWRQHNGKLKEISTGIMPLRSNIAQLLNVCTEGILYIYITT